jgi:hypothetical protein
MTSILTIAEAPESCPKDWLPVLIPFWEHAEALIKN